MCAHSASRLVVAERLMGHSAAERPPHRSARQPRRFSSSCSTPSPSAARLISACRPSGSLAAESTPPPARIGPQHDTKMGIRYRSCRSAPSEGHICQVMPGRYTRSWSYVHSQYTEDRDSMNPGLLWTIVGSGAGVIALGFTAWQVRLQVLERKERKGALQVSGTADSAKASISGLPVAVPLGRLPSAVRGRNALLHELRSVLNWRTRPTNRAWVLAGMGGVGKSTVALSIAEAAQKQGWRVWWVTALNNMSLIGGMVEILHQLDAPLAVIQAVSEGVPTAPARAWQFLNDSHSAGRHWLLIFDNADDEAVLSARSSIPAEYTGWLRPDPTGALIVTTRIADPRVWGNRVSLRLLRPLDPAAAAQVLTDLAPSISDPTGTQADELAARLGGLPLALHLAGRYLSSPFTQWRTFAEYREALDSKGFPQVLSELDDVSAEARDTIQRTWELSLEGLAADGRPQARPMLALLSCYAPATPIPTSLLDPVKLAALFDKVNSLAQAITPPKGEQGRRLVREALDGLGRIGLIQIDGKMSDAGTVTIHPVVADVNRSGLLSDDQLSAVSNREIGSRVALQVRRRISIRCAPQDWPSWRQLFPHLTAMLEWFAPYLEDDAIISLLSAGNPASDALWRCGDLPGAESLARLCVTAAIRLNNDQPAALSARYELATAIGFLGRYAQGEHVNDGQDTNAGISIDPSYSALWHARYHESERILREVLSEQQQAIGRIILILFRPVTGWPGYSALKGNMPSQRRCSVNC